MNLIVTCPSCETLFKLEPEQLEASEGRVRCGHCLEVFNAQAQINQAQALDATHSAQTHHPQPAIDPIQQTQTSPSHLSFVRKARRAQFWSHAWVRGFLFCMALVLPLALAFQILLTEHERVAQWGPTWKSTISRLCQLWPCPKAKAKLMIEGWQIESSSFQKEAAQNFRLTATLKNTSSTRLITPAIELQLLDNNDAVLVRHIITPEPTDPLALTAHAEHTYQWLITPKSMANSPVNLKEISGYRLLLFYP